MAEIVTVERQILKKNDEIAAENRTVFQQDPQKQEQQPQTRCNYFRTQPQ